MSYQAASTTGCTAWTAHFLITCWLCPGTCLLRPRFSLTNLEHKEVKVLWQLPQRKAEPFPFRWSHAAKHTWRIQNLCKPKVTLARPKEVTRCVWESWFPVLRMIDSLLFSLSHETGFSCSNAQMSCTGWPGGSPRTGPLSTLCTCHTVTWIPVFSTLPSPPPPPSFSYIMNNAGRITDPQLTVHSPLLSTPEALPGPSTSFLTTCWYFSQITS